MANYEPCSICEEYIEGVICDKEKCPVGIMKKEVERLRKETSQTIESIRKLARDTIRDTKSEAIKEFEHKILALFPADKNHTTISRFTIKQIVKEMTEVQE